jgi:hypothetical protein
MTLAADLAAALDPVHVFEGAFGMTVLDWQRDYLRETRPTVVLKGRQCGASTAAAALAVHAALYWADTNTVIVSPSLKQSGEILAKARLGLRNLGARLTQDSASMVRLPNGARIQPAWHGPLGPRLDRAPAHPRRGGLHPARDVDRRQGARRHRRPGRRAEHAGRRGGRLPRARRGR